ncbi:RNA 2'-phosphotransferase [Sphaerisporangium rubeum]|uniref:Probable RNA 2'-phosphotransferase n=1 Tax=Sphaerisporangium rubeum TaxID=321317 RepID=A0A7X0II98_9ACTN|nr:RNA 2'-phosphotransferase [Sphaerisporangium rubeum]MBB6475666.1 putative RNA 2'-phosphotransferase [Sphaerisporangium rubeum]
MDQRRLVRVSKYLSKHLRHDPGRIGVTLDGAGWVDVDTFLDAARTHGFPITSAELQQVVVANDKQRFTLEAGRIRANQGHSVEVHLDLPAVAPPPVLYHGTVSRNLGAIRTDGLRRMNRHHVHLSPDRETAVRVGSRRGAPVVLVVDAAAMHAAGHEFMVSANGVWLVEHVPREFLRFPE